MLESFFDPEVQHHPSSIQPSALITLRLLRSELIFAEVGRWCGWDATVIFNVVLCPSSHIKQEYLVAIL